MPVLFAKTGNICPALRRKGARGRPNLGETVSPKSQNNLRTPLGREWEGVLRFFEHPSLMLTRGFQCGEVNFWTDLVSASPRCQDFLKQYHPRSRD